MGQGRVRLTVGMGVLYGALAGPGAGRVSRLCVCRGLVLSWAEVTGPAWRHPPLLQVHSWPAFLPRRPKACWHLQDGIPGLKAPEQRQSV